MSATVRRRAAVAAAVVLALVVAAVARPVARRPDDLGVAGTGPSGLGVLATVLDELGVDVVEGAVAPRPDDVVLVPSHGRPTAEQLALLAEHVAEGGRVVATGGGVDDATRRDRVFAPFALGARLLDDDCDLPRLDGVGRLDPVGNERLVPAPGDVACFRSDDDAALVLVPPTGAGELVLLADDAILRNGGIGLADNVAAAVALLAPADQGRVVVLVRARADGEDVLDLVGGRFWALLWWGVVVFVVVAVRRGRRLGDPVAEQVPVVVEGAALVDAVGALLARSRDHGAAATALRDDARAVVARRMGTGVGDDGTLVARLRDHVRATGVGVDDATIDLALHDGPVRGDAELLRVARAVAAVRAATSHTDRTETG